MCKMCRCVCVCAMLLQRRGNFDPTLDVRKLVYTNLKVAYMVHKCTAVKE